MSSQIVGLRWPKSALRLRIPARWQTRPNWSAAPLQLLPLLLPSIAALAVALAGWRLAADLRWTNSFFIATGFLSHWQVWFAIAMIAQVSASRMNRETVRAIAANTYQIQKRIPTDIAGRRFEMEEEELERLANLSKAA